MADEPCPDCAPLLAAVQEQLQAASDEIVGLSETTRRQAGVIGKLRREDPDKKLRDHADWQRGLALFNVWKRLTGHTKSKWTLARFKAAMPFLAEYEDEVLVRALTGLAADPFITRNANGVEERHDWWQTLFNPDRPDNIERYANKAPVKWRDTLEEHAEEVAKHR